MTAVLSVMSDPIAHSIQDDIGVSYSLSSVDWREKYQEVADMLAETKAELDEVHTFSKELEEELEKETERTEKAQKNLKVKIERTENEREDWKSKFVSLQTLHNTTTTKLQCELDTLRQDHQKIKIQLRELEMGNDDLERNERAVVSSLADAESKYSRALEEKIMIEQELHEKAHLEEDFQRLKDELRDANLEINVLKDQLAAANSRTIMLNIPTTPTSLAPSNIYQNNDELLSSENLLKSPPPPDLQLSDLTSSEEGTMDAILPPPKQGVTQDSETPKAARTRPVSMITSISSTSSKSSQYSRPPIPYFTRPASPPPQDKALQRVTPMSPSRLPARRPFATANSNIQSHMVNPSSRTLSSSTTSSTTSKSKGVQMVSEMRARVKILEQKIHTRVPRLRMGSIGSRAAPSPPSATLTAATGTPMRSVSMRAAGSNLRPRSGRRSADIKRTTTPNSDTSGWVLIMEDSPSPVKKQAQVREPYRRQSQSSPIAPSAFPATQTRLGKSTAPSNQTPNHTTQSALSQTVAPSSVVRRPQSRVSTASSTSSIPSAASRPASPTFLPLPTAGLFNVSKPTGPPQKRASLGMNHGIPTPPTFEPQVRKERPFSYSAKPSDGFKALQVVSNNRAASPNGMNGRFAPTSRLPSSTSGTSLSKSRIGRPSGRRSTGEDSPIPPMPALPSQ